MNLLGSMNSTGPEHMLHPAQRQRRLFRVVLCGNHGEENRTGMIEAIEIATKALKDRGYTVTVDQSSWDYAEGAIVRVGWWSRIVVWIRGLW